MPVADPLLAELETRRARLFERLAAVGDFRRGSISENYCGKPGCRRRAEPGSRGHGPAVGPDGAGPGHGRPAANLEEVAKVRGELADYQEFAELAGQIAEVSKAICEVRPVPAAA
jgi:hypothetical protein